MLIKCIVDKANILLIETGQPTKISQSLDGHYLTELIIRDNEYEQQNLNLSLQFLLHKMFIYSLMENDGLL